MPPAASGEHGVPWPGPVPGAAVTSELLLLPTQGTFLPWVGFGHNCGVHVEFWDAFELEGHIIVKICRCKCKMILHRSYPMAKGTGSSGVCSHGSLPETFIPWCRWRIVDSLWFVLAYICPSIRHISIPWAALCSALWNAEKAAECSVSNSSWETEAAVRSTSMVQAVSRLNNQRLEESPPQGSRIKMKDRTWHGKKKNKLACPKAYHRWVANPGTDRCSLIPSLAPCPGWIFPVVKMGNEILFKGERLQRLSQKYLLRTLCCFVHTHALIYICGGREGREEHPVGFLSPSAEFWVPSAK